MVDLVPVEHDPFSDDIGKQNLSASAAYRRSQAGDESFAPQFVRSRPTLPESIAGSMMETGHMLTTPAPRPPAGVSEDDAGRLVVVDPNSGKFIPWHEVDPQGAGAYYDEMDKRTDLAPSFALGMIGGGANFAQRGALGAAGAKMVQPEGIRAYHGSPHDFDKFDISKIGTGEGAQAYGHGLYFAENPETAKFYKEALSQKPTLHGKPLLDQHYDTATPTGHPYLDEMIKQSFGDMDLLRKTLDANIQAGPAVTDLPFWQKVAAKRVSDSQSALKHLNELEASGAFGTVSPGKTYEVNIAAHPEHFLDWDKPLSEHPQQVKEAFRPIYEGITTRPAGDNFVDVVVPASGTGTSHLRGATIGSVPKDKIPEDLAAWAMDHDPRSGRVLYDHMARRAAQAEQARQPNFDVRNPYEASQMLREAGIPGIKYLDQGSRGAGEGTRNYVVFDPKLIDIVKKYGIAGLGIFPAGAHMLEQVEHDPFKEGKADGGAIEARNRPYVRPVPATYSTDLGTMEPMFRAWVAKNKVPFDLDVPVSDYDMRGFYRALASGDPRAQSAVDPNDKRLHFPDDWKTPQHETFSNQSQWATEDAPQWNKSDQLVAPSGHIIFDDKRANDPDRVPGFAHGGRVDANNIDHAPTEAQKEAGNYAKDHVRIHGLDITIENAKGATRSGVDRGGKPWSVKMPAHYGYIKGTVGKDKDHVDVYVGPHLKSPRVFVVDQNDAHTGKFDEHKAFVGFASAMQVEKTYAAAFSDGRAKDRLGHVAEMSVDGFKHWLENGDTTKPAKHANGGAVAFKDNSEIGLAQNAPGVHFQCRTCKFDDNGTCRNPNPKLDGRKIKPHWCCNLYDHEGMKVIA